MKDFETRKKLFLALCKIIGKKNKKSFVTYLSTKKI